MAILEKIRRRSIVLIIVIGLSLFAFVISDLLTKSTSGSVAGSSIGEINGTEVSIENFRNRVKSVTDNYRASGVNITTKQSVDFAWNEILREEIFDSEFKKIGLNINSKEVYELAAPMLSRNKLFQDEEGNYQPNKVREYIEDIRMTNPSGYQQWKIQEKIILRNAKIKQYETLISAGLNATPLQSKQNYRREHEKVSIEYVTIPYDKVADSLVKVSDNEIAAYIKQHHKLYKQDAKRDLRYIVFEETASKDDTDALKKELTKYMSPFEEYNHATKNTEKVPSFQEAKNNKTYVNNYSDQPYRDKYLFKSDLSPGFAKDLFNLKKNTLFGPYEDGGYLKISKVVSRKIIPDSVKSSHIIVPFLGAKSSGTATKTKEQAKATIDSIFHLVRRNKKKFSEIASTINTDATKVKNGDVGWLQYSKISDATFDRKFSDYIFFNPQGSIAVVETGFGYHIIRIDKQKSKKYAIKLASISKKILPSEETVNRIFSRSIQFEMDVASGKLSFDAAVKRDSLTVKNATNLNILDEYVGNLGNHREIVKWSFEKGVKKGDIKRFNVNNNNVIAQIVGKKDQGLKSVNQVKRLVAPIIQKQKKRAMLLQQYGQKNMADIENENNTSKGKVENITLDNPLIQELGKEPKLVGVALNLQQGQESNIIEGETGIFKIKVLSKIKAPDADTFLIYQQKQKDIYTSRARGVFKTLKNTYEIEDKRHLFY